MKLDQDGETPRNRPLTGPCTPEQIELCSKLILPMPSPELVHWRRIDDYLKVESEDYIRSAIEVMKRRPSALNEPVMRKLAQRPSKSDAVPEVVRHFEALVHEVRAIIADEVARLEAEEDAKNPFVACNGVKVEQLY